LIADFELSFFFAVVPDGYGLSYSIDDGYIRWTMTCLKEMGKKNKGAKDLKKVLQEAADEVKGLLERVGKPSEEAKPKL
jgi:carnitine O-acetyltransferase